MWAISLGALTTAVRHGQKNVRVRRTRAFTRRKWVYILYTPKDDAVSVRFETLVVKSGETNTTGLLVVGGGQWKEYVRVFSNFTNRTIIYFIRTRVVIVPGNMENGTRCGRNNWRRVIRRCCALEIYMFYCITKCPSRVLKNVTTFEI